MSIYIAVGKFRANKALKAYIALLISDHARCTTANYFFFFSCGFRPVIAPTRPWTMDSRTMVGSPHDWIQKLSQAL
jgi:hypothetical protein